MKTLLVPIDFSPASHHALRYACQWGRSYRARIVVMHVFQPPMSEPYMDYSLQANLLMQQEELARERFDQWIEEMPVEIRQEMQISFRVEMGFPGEEIMRVAREISPDLIAFGMQGGNPLVKKLMGSTVTSVLQRTEFPVLIVPETCNFDQFKHIAYATDYLEDDIRVIDEVLYFARKHHAKLSCIHVRTKPDTVKDDYKNELLKRAYYYDMTHDHIDFRVINHEDVVTGITHFVNWKEIDLLVMLTHHHSGIGKLFHHSNSREMALLTHIPLWVYPMKRQPVPATS